MVKEEIINNCKEEILIKINFIANHLKDDNCKDSKKCNIIDYYKEQINEELNDLIEVLSKD